MVPKLNSTLLTTEIDVIEENTATECNEEDEIGESEVDCEDAEQTIEKNTQIQS